MASTYSTNLALELIATGEQVGVWGVTTNTNLGTLLEQAISGYVTQAITDGSGANTTITIPNGATGVARNMFIEMTGALTFATTNLVVPANKKLYFVYNNTTGGFPVTVKVSGQTGVSVPNGVKLLLVSNGTDVVNATSYVYSGPITNSLSGNVSLNNTSNYFTGPSCAQGTSGTWFASGTVTVADTSGNIRLYAKLWDGTTVIASTEFRIDGAANASVSIPLSGYLSTPAGNIRISVQLLSSTVGSIIYNATGTGKDSTLTVYRIA